LREGFQNSAAGTAPLEFTMLPDPTDTADRTARLENQSQTETPPRLHDDRAAVRRRITLECSRELTETMRATVRMPDFRHSHARNVGAACSRSGGDPRNENIQEHLPFGSMSARRSESIRGKQERPAR
jgi:hypothetical protein